MSLKDVPVRARLWAPDRSLPRFLGRLLLFFVRFNLTFFAQYIRAAEARGGVAQACRAAPSGDDKVRKCCPREPCCTLGRRRCTKVLPKRAVLHPRAMISVVFVAEGFPSSILHSALRPWATERRGRVALLCRASPSGAGQSGVIVPGELGAASCSCRWRGSGGSVAWSCGHYIGHYIRHIRLIFGNFYYFCPDVCHAASRPVPVTQGRSGIQTERVTDGRQVIYQGIAELIGLTRL